MNNPPRCSALAGLAVLLLVAPAHAGIKLKKIQFPVGATESSGPTSTLAPVPLSQRVVFVFDGKPKLGPAVAEGLRIRVADSNVSGQTPGDPAIGTYEVDGKRVIFTPRLPTDALVEFGPASDINSYATLPGLLPATIYDVAVDADNPDAVTNLNSIAGSLPLPITFTTVPVVPPAAALATYFANFDDLPPTLKNKNGVLPKPGAGDLSPNLFLDPAGLFSSIPDDKRPPFRLRFKGPLAPDPDALAATIRLRSVQDEAGTPVDLPISITTALTMNTVDGAEVLIFPNAILPLGHQLSFEVADALASIEGVTAGAGAPPSFGAVAAWTVSSTPTGGGSIFDSFEEDFDTTKYQDSSVALEGNNLAAWDAADSNHLRATSTFGGIDALGRFEAPPFDTFILIDTDYQTFPLFNGATPDAKAGTVVTDGVFHFSSFYLPPGVTLRAVGSNPLVITCTESCLIEGRISVSGSSGASSNSFDSGIHSIPGGSAGAGGGRGGNGHPIVAPPQGGSLLSILSPAFGGSGKGPGGIGLGGGGGQSGCSMPWSPFLTGQCGNFSPFGDGSRGSGGGGGSFANFLADAPETAFLGISGRGGAIGTGDHLPVTFDPFAPIPPEPAAYDAQPGNPTNAVAMPNPNPTFAEMVEQGHVWDSGSQFNINTDWARTRRVTLGGAAGPAVFADGDPDNDFIGPGGELPTLRGGQGGGAGATRTEGLTRDCMITMHGLGLPGTVLDAQGGSGGGAAGAVRIQALGTIELRGAGAGIEAIGGNGGGGEGSASSSRGGAGGGASGGAVVLQSAANVLIDHPLLPSLTIDVSGGCYANAINLSNNTVYGTAPGGDIGVLQFADGGTGGPGLVQIHVPEGAPDRVDEARIGAHVYLSAFKLGGSQSLGCSTTGRTQIPALVDRAKTPAAISSVSVARSTWIDLGAVTSDFRPPVVTSAGPLAGPVFGVPGDGPLFVGTDPLTGLVPTDRFGNVPLLAGAHIEVDAPDFLKADFIPNGPTYYQSVTVLFQGADEDAGLPGTPDLATTTAWVTDATQLNAKQFFRWEIRIDMASNPAIPVDLFTPRPQVNRLRVPFRF